MARFRGGASVRASVRVRTGCRQVETAVGLALNNHMEYCNFYRDHHP